MREKKILVYYITTGTYINYSDLFFSSLKNFMPNYKKDVVWISDNFKEINIEGINIIKKQILDMPWPLIALLKMHYINNNKISGYDGYFYFNANSKIIKMKNESIDTIEKALQTRDFICSRHACFPEDNLTTHKQGGFFGGNEQTFFGVCSLVVQYIDEQLLKNQIPTWHDETALNYVLNKYNINCCYKPFMIWIKKFPKEMYLLDTLKTLFVIIVGDEYKAKKGVTAHD